jgi:hypothetical protein
MHKLKIYNRLVNVGIVLSVSLLSITLPFFVGVAHAVLPNPAWWVNNLGAFSQYDTYQYNNGRTHQGTFYSGTGTNSNILSANASYDGVAAVGPLPSADGDALAFFTTDANAVGQWEWQCVEW